jgi:hypothetical protein
MGINLRLNCLPESGYHRVTYPILYAYAYTNYSFFLGFMPLLFKYGYLLVADAGRSSAHRYLAC